MTEDTLHDEAVFQPIATLRVERIDNNGLSRCGQFVLHIIQQGQEIIDLTYPSENIRVSAPLDQLFELLPGTVQDGGDAQCQ